MPAMQRGLALLTATALLSAVLVAPAAAAADPTAGASRDYAAITVDMLLLRPLSVMSTLLGSALFVISLPITAPFRVVGAASDQLVVEPGAYAFTRPLGQI